MSQLAQHPIDAIQVRFPADVYADVRLEHIVSHTITIRDGVLDTVEILEEMGALIRVLKDGQWYFASTTEIDTIDSLLDALAHTSALPEGTLAGIDAQYEIHNENVRRFDSVRVSEVALSERRGLLERFYQQLDRPDIPTSTGIWRDQYRDRRFVSSRGADVRQDYQEAGVTLLFTVTHDKETLAEHFVSSAHHIQPILDQLDQEVARLKSHLDKCARFVQNATPVVPGEYPVILAPNVAGVFAHESFGHKSEADFMLGDPSMLEAWQIGTRIGNDTLTIIDAGTLEGSGWSPFDDEGQPSRTTRLIDKGLLNGRLHSAQTASELGESLTGNARAISFRFEPIVRMTSTFIEPGTLSREELFAGIDDGYFIETYSHGSGMSTFTIAPLLAWRIRNGVLAEPTRIAVLTGTVFETLGEIDGLSDTVEREFLTGGGCGKFEQWPLSVSYGGPYVRIRKMQVA